MVNQVHFWGRGPPTASILRSIQMEALWLTQSQVDYRYDRFLGNDWESLMAPYTKLLLKSITGMILFILGERWVPWASSRLENLAVYKKCWQLIQFFQNNKAVDKITRVCGVHTFFGPLDPSSGLIRRVSAVDHSCHFPISCLLSIAETLNFHSPWFVLQNCTFWQITSLICMFFS